MRQLFGFVYLRALRTGSRALSLERGSLLDLILEGRGVRTGLWETAIQRLRGLAPPIDEGAESLVPILENIEQRLAQYIPLEPGSRATQLFVSQLTREHLRRTIAFFLRTEPGQEPVPFQHAGSGTLNALVLALLSFIAETKRDSVVFAMEEPEIALPPHTQRRVTKYLLESSDQCFVTSHSPYVIECFQPEQIRILRRAPDAALEARELRIGETLKAKVYRRHTRRSLAEAMLGHGVIVCEGITERDVVLATAEKLEADDPAAHYPLDLSGVSVLTAEGEGSLAEFGEFFTDLGMRAYALFDQKPMKADLLDRVKGAFTYACRTTYRGAETLLSEECPAPRLWEFLEAVRASGDKPGLVPTGPMPAPDEVRRIACSVLQGDKGSGYGGRLIHLCSMAELPSTVAGFLERVYADFKRPLPVSPIEGTSSDATASGAPAAAFFAADRAPTDPTVSVTPRAPTAADAPAPGAPEK